MTFMVEWRLLFIEFVTLNLEKHLVKIFIFEKAFARIYAK